MAKNNIEEFDSAVKYLEKQDKYFLIGLIMGMTRGNSLGLREAIKYIKKQTKKKARRKK